MTMAAHAETEASIAPATWQSLLDAMSAPATVFGRDLVFMGQNKAHEAMTGRQRGDVVGRYMFDAFPAEPGPDAPSAEAAIHASIRRVWASGLPDLMPVQEHALESRDGSWQTHFWKITHAPIIEDGAVVAILQTSEDVTEKALSDALSRAQRLAAQDAAAVSYFTYEPESERLVRAEAVDLLFGFEEGEAGPLAGPFLSRIDPADAPSVRRELERARSQPLGAPVRIDFRTCRPGQGAGRTVRLRGAMVIDPEDQQRKLVGVVVDMTDFEQARQGLEQALREKENLLIEVNHRVKNSLQLASSILRLEARKTRNPETQSVLAKANARVDAIAEVHGGIYLGGDVTWAPIDAILKNIVDALGRSVGAGDTCADIACTAAQVSLPTDRAIAFGLLVNELLTNALKHGGGPDARAISVSTQIDGSRIVLTVSNDCNAAPEAGPPQGTGIGASLIAGFVRQLGGTLSEGADNDRYVVTVVFSDDADGTEPPRI
ncbi:MAG: histidine kinase dimerization/phosphoacceptor domain -containing protein [Pseudomonadota bacterium]